MNKGTKNTLEELKRAIDIRKRGLKPKRGGVYLNMFGDDGEKFEFNGKFYTEEELKKELEGWENIDGLPNVFFIIPHDEIKTRTTAMIALQK